MDTNGIKDLSTDRRRSVAASVFDALEEARTGTKTPEYPHPIFTKLLDSKEKAVALGLITSNIERVGRTVELVETAKYATTVTRAIAIVLFTMAGLRVSLKRDWKAEEEVAALYAVRKNMIHVFRSFSQKVDDAQRKPGPVQDSGQERVEDFRQRLASELKKVNFYALSQRIEAPWKEKGTVRVPLVSSRSILVNGTTASFADVMAPFMLTQSKGTSRGGTVPFVLKNELQKCCLLKDCKDDRPLRGLLAVWSDQLDFLEDNVPLQPLNDSSVACDEEDSDAFPENLFKYMEPIDSVQYGLIKYNSSSIEIPGGRSVPLPELKNVTITYMIVTNARSVRIHIDKVRQEIDEGMLRADKTLDITKLKNATVAKDEEEKGNEKREPVSDSVEEHANREITSGVQDVFLGKWNELMGDLREKVTIKFLFTRSG
jgi:hypothetical protein